MESNHNYFIKCVLCERPAEYIIRGDSMCREHRDSEELALRILQKGHNEEQN